MKKYLHKTLRFSALSLLTFLLFSNPVYSQWSTDIMINNPMVTDINQQNSCQMVTDGSGGAIVTWWDYNLSSGDYNIYAERINSEGALQWNPRGVPICTNPALQHTPKITSDGNGGAIITWFDQRNVKNEIFAQKINSAGIVQWSADGVSVGTTPDHYQQGSPCITSDGSGGAIIAFEDWRGTFEQPALSIHAQRINSAGNPSWAPGGVALNLSSSTSSGSPQIVSDGNGGAIVAWDEWVGDLATGNRNIFAQKVSSAGSIAWGADGLTICDQTSEQRLPFLTGDGSGGAIIAWEDVRSGKSNLYAQKVSSGGLIQWSANGVQVTDPASHNQINQRLLEDGSGGTFIAFETSTGTVFVQHLDATGTKLWTGEGVYPGGFNVAKSPAIAPDGSNGIVVAWNDDRSDIRAQRITSSGSFLWYAGGVWVTYANSNQLSPKVVADVNGGFIIAWDDYRNSYTSSTDIYAQKITGNGNLGGTTSINDNQMISARIFDLAGNYPNPFTGSTSINYSVSAPVQLSLKVYDITGKMVLNLLDGEVEPGNYTVTITENLPAGIYYYTMRSGSASESRSMVKIK